MYCRNCDEQIPDIAEVCVHCGARPALAHKYCWYCGKPTSPHQEVCLECGVLQKRKSSSEEVSGAWWLMPVFFGWLGGVVAWVVNKDRDPEKARSMLGTGIILSVVGILAYCVLICVSLANN